MREKECRTEQRFRQRQRCEQSERCCGSSQRNRVRICVFFFFRKISFFATQSSELSVFEFGFERIQLHARIKKRKSLVEIFSQSFDFPQGNPKVSFSNSMEAGEMQSKKQSIKLQGICFASSPSGKNLANYLNRRCEATFFFLLKPI